MDFGPAPDLYLKTMRKLPTGVKERKLTDHKIGTREEWLVARERLLVREKEHTRLGDELALQRRELPWVQVGKEYRFDTDDGEKSLAELFDGRSQLLVYHFMFGPSYEAGCPINSSIADSVDGVLRHLHARDVTFLLVSQAPLEKLQSYKRRMGGAFLGFDCPHGLQPRPRLLAHGGTGPRGGSADDGERATADRGAERQGDGHRSRRLPHGEPRLQHVRTRRRRRLPHIFDDVARTGVRHGVLPDPRPRTERTRRGRGGSSGSAGTTSTRVSDEYGQRDGC